MRQPRVRYYTDYTEDFEQTAKQDYTLPPDYEWVPRGLRARLLSHLIYGTALIVGGLYCRLHLHVRVRGREKLKGMPGALFLYGNHTQPFGDVIIPALCLRPRRIYTLVSPANYGIPVIGRILPYLGALPISSTLHGMRSLNAAIDTRLYEGHPIVIYPEAHVWEYCTEIRPFGESAFRYPAKADKPVFAMTVTYRRARFLRRPRAVVWLDGPLYAQGGTLRERSESLRAQVRTAMQTRALESDYAYIRYEQRTDPPSADMQGENDT